MILEDERLALLRDYAASAIREFTEVSGAAIALLSEQAHSSGGAA
jgi:hypothetical protein